VKEGRKVKEGEGRGTLSASSARILATHSIVSSSKHVPSIFERKEGRKEGR
jgi:hypothetical protein